MAKLVNPQAFENLSQLAAAFQTAEPFPHVVIDDFLLPEVAEAIHDEVRSTPTDLDSSNNITQRLKTACVDWDEFGDLSGRLISYFNSSKFIEPMEKITGIDGLFGDPSLEGGGIHQTIRGGFLKMHTDFNWNEKLRADRRVNILYYLNKDWKPEYRGELIISKIHEKAQKAIEPVFNRLVIFNTNDTTLHGHPFPLQFPEGYSRASIAMYYYSAGVEADGRLRKKATTTRYLPLEPGDIDLASGTMRARVGYLLRRFSRF